MGILITIVGFIGFYINKLKFETKNVIFYFLIFVSAVLLIRFNSYQAFLKNETTQLFDSREIAVYIESNNDFVRPDIGDQCWINLKCHVKTLLVSTIVAFSKLHPDKSLTINFSNQNFITRNIF